MRLQFAGKSKINTKSQIADRKLKTERQLRIVKLCNILQAFYEAGGGREKKAKQNKTIKTKRCDQCAIYGESLNAPNQNRNKAESGKV